MSRKADNRQTWEVIAVIGTRNEQVTRRLPVPGGWLYQTVTNSALRLVPDFTSWVDTTDTVFVADPRALHLRRPPFFPNDPDEQR